MSFTPSVSPQFAGLQSPHRALQSLDVLLNVDAQYLINLKQWPGTNSSSWMNVGRPGGINPNVVHLKSVDDRKTFRRRYSMAEVNLVPGSLSPPGYNSTWSLTGSGNLPQNQGMLGLIDQDPSWFAKMDFLTFGAFDGDVTFPGFRNYQYGSFTGFSRQGNLLSQPPNPPDTLNEVLSGEVQFSNHLTAATQRILTRAFPAFSPGQVAGEFLGEYSGWSGLLPQNQWPPLDGQWHAGAGYQGAPYFGWFDPFPANQDTSVLTSLWTGWFWRTDEEAGSFVDEQPYSFPIVTQRCRFRTTASVPYFIGRATINRVTGIGPAPDGPDSLWNVRMLASGTTTAGTPIEIPWPSGDAGQDDFVASELFNEGVPTLSCGSCCFAIIGEPVQAWQSRTGFVLFG